MMELADYAKSLAYYPKSGKFVRIKPGRWFGTFAGSPTKAGYILIHVGKERVYAHRLAWLFVHGEWPNGVVDHIDGDPGNNSIQNLRCANKSQNGYNRLADPMRGIRWYEPLKKWQARISKDRREYHLGYFASLDDARSAYTAKAIDLYGEFACRP